MVWVNVLLNPPVPGWGVALLIACIGGWSRIFPARRHWMLLLRGALMMAAINALLIEPALGGATGPYFYTLMLVVIAYSLLLPPHLAIGMAAMAMVEYAIACWMSYAPLDWKDILIHAGLLGVIPPLTILFGQSMRLSDEHAESSMQDSRTLLYNETGFFVHGAMLLQDCLKREKPFSMVLLNGSGLRDVPERLGRRAANDLFRQVVEGIGRVPGEGIAARTEALEFALLLPGLHRDQAMQLVHAQLGNPPKVTVYLAGQQVVVTLDIEVAHTVNKSRTIESIYDILHARLVARRAPLETIFPDANIASQADDTLVV
jgi:GGDEF domain-containing protein